ncbi:MAG: hypothetical protein HN368_18930 [Spirochaetales bacterium]|nr:hypothetical protein [Spirochaetales bacterium]
MKKIIYVIPFILVAFFGCTFFETIIGSGNLVETQLIYTNFDGLDIDAPFEVTLIQDNEYSVTIMTDDNVIDHVMTSMEGSTLSIDLASYYGFTGVSLKAVITMPTLRVIDLSSASTLTVIGSSSLTAVSALRISLSDASHLLLPSVVADNLTLDLDGASKATVGAYTSLANVSVTQASTLLLDGSGYSVDVVVDGASDADLSEFAANSASVTAGGASEAWININGTIGINLTGASTLYYTGTATWVSLNFTEGSSIILLN